ncbi:AI-2E family transporter [Vibrio sp. WJH972]
MSNPIKITSNHWVILTALLVAALFCYLLIEPYVHILVLAFIIMMLMYPIHQRIENKIPTYPNLASLLSCLLLTFIIVLPLLLVAGAISQQGVKFSQSAYSWIEQDGFSHLMAQDWVTEAFAFANSYLPFDDITPATIGAKASELISQFGTKMVGSSAKLLGNATGFLASFLLMLFVLFFLLRDYDKIIYSLRHILPLSRSQEDRLLNEIETVSKSAVLGSFLTAIAQGVAGGIGMWVVGFPGLFWGTMMGFASFIPMVGTALIWLPAAFYLFATGDTGWAIFLIIWSVVVVGSIDNVLRPLLMQGSSGMSTLLIFFSLLGGINYYGLMGIIYGPLVFAIALVLFNIYEEEFKDFLNRQDNS